MILGATNKSSGIIERDINLKIARYLKEYLEKYEDVTVLLTHNGDIASDTELPIVTRGMYARCNNADLVISIHNNDSTNLSLTGAEVYVTRYDKLPKYNQKSTELGNMILYNLSLLGLKNNGVRTRLCNDEGPKWQYSDGEQADYYGIIRYPMKGEGDTVGIDLLTGEGIPSILIEHGYMNTSDVKYMDSDDDLKSLAIADGQAIVKFYNLELYSPDNVKMVILEKSKQVIPTGGEFNIKYEIAPITAINKAVTFTSSNNEVATVDANGKVNGISSGKAIITVTSVNRNKTAQIEIEVEDIKIKVDKKEIKLLNGNIAKVDAVITPRLAENEIIYFESENPEIATVDSTGIITSISGGNTKIKLLNKERVLVDEVNVEVTDNVVNIEEDEILENQEKNKTEKYSINMAENYNLQYDYVSKINEKTTVEQFLNKINTSENIKAVIKDPKGKELESNELITSNSKICFKDIETDNIVQENTCVITGDINMDGKVSAGDYVLIKNYIMDDNYNLLPIQIKAGDVKRDSKISAGDYVLIKNHIMDILKINPQ